MLPGTLVPVADFIRGENALTVRTFLASIPCVTSAGITFGALQFFAAWAVL